MMQVEVPLWYLESNMELSFMHTHFIQNDFYVMEAQFYCKPHFKKMT